MLKKYLLLSFFVFNAVFSVQAATRSELVLMVVKRVQANLRSGVYTDLLHRPVLEQGLEQFLSDRRQLKIDQKCLKAFSSLTDSGYDHDLKLDCHKTGKQLELFEQDLNEKIKKEKLVLPDACVDWLKS